MKKYIGVRTTQEPYLDSPQLDLEVYQSSSGDLDFKKDQLLNPQNYRYIILSVFSNRRRANKHETWLLKELHTKSNPEYYNNSSGWRKQNFEPKPEPEPKPNPNPKTPYILQTLQKCRDNLKNIKIYHQETIDRLNQLSIPLQLRYQGNP